MGWEMRQRGGPYYYRSVREGDRVRKEYIGGGVLGRLAAQLDDVKRRQREEEATYWREERERLEQDARFVWELGEVAGLLTRTHLVAAGYAKHKGEWRKRRERSA